MPFKAAGEIGPPDVPVVVRVVGGDLPRRQRRPVRTAVAEAFAQTGLQDLTGERGAASGDGRPEAGRSGGGGAGARELTPVSAAGGRREHRHFRVAWVVQRLLQAKFGSHWVVIVGQDLCLNVRYRKGYYLRMVAQTRVQDSPKFDVLLFRCVPDSEELAVPTVSLTNYDPETAEADPASALRNAVKGDSGAKEDGEKEASGAAAAEEEDDGGSAVSLNTVRVFASTMPAAVERVAVRAVDVAYSSADGDDNDFVKRVKEEMTRRFGSTWHVVSGALTPGFCLAATADRGAFMEARVGKHKKVFMFRNAIVEASEGLTAGGKRLMMYLLALLAFFGFMYLQYQCEWDCADGGVLFDDCTDESREAVASCATSSRYLAGIAVVLVVLASGSRYLGIFSERVVTPLEVSKAAKDV